MVRFASALEEKGYRTIWIDCEEHHTTEGVVDDVIDQIRTLDPLFPPYLMRTGESLGQAWGGPGIAAKIGIRNLIDKKQFEPRRRADPGGPPAGPLRPLPRLARDDRPTSDRPP